MTADARTSGADEVHRMLRDAQRDAVREARQVVAKGMLNIKNDWREAWRGFNRAPRIHRSITYDVKVTGDVIRGECGPDVDKPGLQGYLGNLIEFGSDNNAPHPGGAPALRDELPRFQKAVEDLGEDLLR